MPRKHVLKRILYPVQHVQHFIAVEAGNEKREAQHLTNEKRCELSCLEKGNNQEKRVSDFKASICGPYVVPF